MLSQVDGHLTLEEIAAVCSMDLAETAKIGSRLVELGAARTSETERPQREQRGRRTPRVAIEEVARAVADPRAEEPSLRPSPPSERASRRPDPRAEQPSLRPTRPAEKQPRRSERPSGKQSLRPASNKNKTNEPLEKAPERRRSRSSMRMQRASSRRIKAARKNTPPPVAPAAPAAPSAETSAARLRKLQAAAKEIEVQARVAPLLFAAEEALKANDVINAANNFRLALQHREDPFVRLKLEEVDRLARAVRVERSIAFARAAENDGRWGDAALHFARAHETKPTAEIADRAANALRRGQGDLERAAALAEQAVSLDPKNARYRMTLGEVCLAADQLTRAATQAEAALELAPKDPRAQELAAAIARAKKATR